MNSTPWDGHSSIYIWREVVSTNRANRAVGGLGLLVLLYSGAGSVAEKCGLELDWGGRYSTINPLQMRYGQPCLSFE